jgi:hypothetical protein
VFINGADAWAGHRGMVGGALWRQDVFNPNAGPEARRVELLSTVRILQKFDGGNYGALVKPLAGGNLTTSLAAIAGASFQLDATQANAFPGKVPAWRVEGDIEGATAGDTINVQVRGLTNTPLGSGDRTAVATATVSTIGSAGPATTPDISSNARTATLVGSANLSTGSSGKFGESMIFSGGRVEVPQIAFPSLFYMDCWIKPDTGRTDAGFIMGQWKNGATTGQAIVNMWYSYTDQSITIWMVDSSGAFQATQTSTNTVPAGQWSYVVVGIEAAGYILTGAATGGATTVHLEDPGFPNGHPHSGDGTIPFTIGDMYGGGQSFYGRIDSPRFMSGAMPSADYATPTSAPSSDVNILLHRGCRFRLQPTMGQFSHRTQQGHVGRSRTSL